MHQARPVTYVHLIYFSSFARIILFIFQIYFLVLGGKKKEKRKEKKKKNEDFDLEKLSFMYTEKRQM